MKSKKVIQKTHAANGCQSQQTLTLQKHLPVQPKTFPRGLCLCPAPASSPWSLGDNGPHAHPPAELCDRPVSWCELSGVFSFASRGSAGTKVSLWQTPSGLRAPTGLPVPAQTPGLPPRQPSPKTPFQPPEGCQSLCWDDRRSPALLAHPQSDIPACPCPQGGVQCPGLGLPCSWLGLRQTLTAAPGSPRSPWLTFVGSHHPTGCPDRCPFTCAVSPPATGFLSLCPLSSLPAQRKMLSTIPAAQ